MGRPSDLSPEVQDAICDALRKGAPRVAACWKAGIDKRTFDRWEITGNADREAERDTPHARFCLAVERACVEGIERLLARVEAGQIGWQGSAWILERVHHELFGRRLAPEDKAHVETLSQQWAAMWAKPDRRGRKGA